MTSEAPPLLADSSDIDGRSPEDAKVIPEEESDEEHGSEEMDVRPLKPMEARLLSSSADTEHQHRQRLQGQEAEFLRQSRER